MRCEEVVEHLPDFVLGTLSETEHAAVRRHLRGCGACRADAAALDRGVAMFTTAAHPASDPPPELQSRVMSALAEEWSDSPARGVRRPVVVPRWAAAAAVVVLAGALAWAGLAQGSAVENRQDAEDYRRILSVLGGVELRVAELRPTVRGVEADVVIYDSHRGQSWAGVLLHAPGVSDPVAVELSNAAGKVIEFAFPIEINEVGRGATWLDTPDDISSFDRIRLIDATGRTIAAGVTPASDD